MDMLGTGWVEMGSYSTLVAVGIWTLQRQGYSIFHSGWECTGLVHNLEEQVAYLCIPLGDAILVPSPGLEALPCSAHSDSCLCHFLFRRMQHALYEAAPKSIQKPSSAECSCDSSKWCQLYGTCNTITR